MGPVGWKGRESGKKGGMERLIDFRAINDDQVSKLEVPSVIYNPKHIISSVPSPYFNFFLLAPPHIK